ncbi:MAG: hypothetical protein ABSF34_20170, partial [Verrucomicrobiota bacterium]
MGNNAIKPWVEVISLHPDVLSPNFSEEIFALDLGPLADGNPQVPGVYRDPEHFFRASYLTNGLRLLLQDVLSRLEGGAGNRVRMREIFYDGAAFQGLPLGQLTRGDVTRQMEWVGPDPSTF